MTDFHKGSRLLQMMFSTQEGGAETFFEKLCFGFSEVGIQQCVVIEPNEERESLLSSYQGVEVVPIRFGGYREWSARRHLRAAFSSFCPDIALSWMNRASRRIPHDTCPVVGRLGGYYKLKHYAKCDHLVGITPDLVDHITANAWAEERVSLIPNFGETQHIDDLTAPVGNLREKLGIPSEETVLLALGRLHEVKAHDILIKALSQVDGATLLLAGEGPLRGYLETLVSELGLDHRVHFLGWRRDVANLFAACDISVFPSRYEPNGTVVMESWAHRKPLIASRAKGPDWLVDDGKNGLLFDIDSIDQLAEKISLLQENQTLRDELVKCGLQKWQKGFSRDAIVGNYLALFGRLLS